jgi:hypothetical protein
MDIGRERGCPTAPLSSWPDIACRWQRGAVVTVTFVAGTSVALWQAREARLAAETAKAVQGFIESVFNASSGNQSDLASARATTRANWIASTKSWHRRPRRNRASTSCLRGSTPKCRSSIQKRSGLVGKLGRAPPATCSKDAASSSINETSWVSVSDFCPSRSLEFKEVFMCTLVFTRIGYFYSL